MSLTQRTFKRRALLGAAVVLPLSGCADMSGPFGPKPKFFVPPMRSAVLFPKLASTGADLVFATVFPSAWKLPDGFSQFVP